MSQDKNKSVVFSTNTNTSLLEQFPSLKMAQVRLPRIDNKLRSSMLSSVDALESKSLPSSPNNPSARRRSKSKNLNEKRSKSRSTSRGRKFMSEAALKSKGSKVMTKKEISEKKDAIKSEEDIDIVITSKRTLRSNSSLSSSQYTTDSGIGQSFTPNNSSPTNSTITSNIDKIKEEIVSLTNLETSVLFEGLMPDAQENQMLNTRSQDDRESVIDDTDSVILKRYDLRKRGTPLRQLPNEIRPAKTVINTLEQDEEESKSESSESQRLVLESSTSSEKSISETVKLNDIPRLTIEDDNKFKKAGYLRYTNFDLLKLFLLTVVLAGLLLYINYHYLNDSPFTNYYFDVFNGYYRDIRAKIDRFTNAH